MQIWDGNELVTIVPEKEEEGTEYEWTDDEDAETEEEDSQKT